MILPFTNLDLLSVGVTIAGIGVAGFSIYFSDPTSVSNRAFLLFTVVTIFWGIANYLNYNFANALVVLWILRVEIFLGVWQAFSFFLLVYVFPDQRKVFPRSVTFLLLPLTILISALTLSPLVFNHVISLAPIGQVSTVAKGPAIILFIGIVLYLFIAAFYTLVRKINRAEGVLKSQLKVMFYGLLCTFLLIAIFNFFLPAAFNILGLAPLGALFVLPFIAATFYAMDKYRLLNAKAVAAVILVTALAIISFADIIFATTFDLILFRSSIFVLVLCAGVLLIKSVLREVEQRELIEKQEQDLEEANKRQENLIHFISHEVKGYLSKSEAAFASIGEEDYGPISAELKKMSGAALEDMRKGVETVMDILDAGNFKKGTITFVMQPFDLRAEVSRIFEQFKGAAEERHLSFNLSVMGDVNYTVVGDAPQLSKHVLYNLIDNGIKYTPHGSVDVSLSGKGGKLLFSVKDSGVGVTQEDKAHLFTEGGRGKDSIKVNAHSTGYGLFIAKSIVEKHYGRIWVESEGQGKGSTFFVELPAKDAVGGAMAAQAPSTSTIPPVAASH